MGCVAFKARPRSQSRILMLGLDYAGKSTLLYRLKLNERMQTSPTVGFNVETMGAGKKDSATIWDVGGQDQLRAHWKDYLEGTDGLIFVVDGSDRTRLGVAGKELRRVLNHTHLTGVPFLVIANKQDLPRTVALQEIMDTLRLKRWHDREWDIRACSAHTGEGIAQTRQAVAALVKRAQLKKRGLGSPSLVGTEHKREAPAGADCPSGNGSPSASEIRPCPPTATHTRHRQCCTQD
ncbi:ADP-ribosylation factor-like protein 11 [Callorhinchus milii]|uniref:ADP-ribosylation factor-like protein 11 n=1 Tax=Callorhinchus milii TaxID=7868 RepID=UPI00045744D0|nr:ADP-ribosylation factor-like protein 11 [Callorhinchus milii]|eukprot:gi/632988360/ref/XP_007883068.1/ PREDICTED: ADP-ribosylation factor-like protein 11 [Callorhinchus milii]